VSSRNDWFKAIADPTRRQILHLLFKHGEMTAGELTQHFDMSKPLMSHHFTVLKDAEMVTTRRDGKQIFYALNTTVIQDLVRMVLDLYTNDGGRKESDS
jgi:DNA-binding transcriptional ArsR family regulator